jgi:CHAT domain-containing protein/Flp pilus assembly protein TadD
MSFLRTSVVVAALLALPQSAALRADGPDKPPAPGGTSGTIPPLVLRGELTAKNPLDRVLKQSGHKVHEVQLEAGQLYAIELRSTVFDAYLRLEDTAGKQLAEDDDSGGGTDARLLYRPPQGGVYRVIATVLPGGVGTGPYTLTVRLANARDEQEAKAAALHAQGLAHSRRGELSQAEQAWRQALALRQKLYLPRGYPQGHPDLALSLNSLGYLLQARGDLAGAEPFLRDALAMRRKLYSAAQFPGGHPELANSLNNVGMLLKAQGDLAGAEPFYRDALAMYRQLYPTARFPAGHSHLASCLNNLGALLKARGDLAGAEPFYRDALAMQRQLYPQARFPEGHSDLAGSLNGLGVLLKAQGDLAGAEPFYRDALAMKRQLYPATRFPAGHPDLARSLNNLGGLLQARGDLAGAEPFLRDALAMRRQLYPEARFPAGHPDLALSLNNLGTLLYDRGDLAGAEPFYRDALAMRRQFYPAARFPDGHPDLAICLNNLGFLLQARGDLAGAEPFYRDALAMYRQFYPAARFPAGHPDLASCLNNLGLLLDARGDLAGAEPFFRDALAMYRQLYPAARFPAGHPYLGFSLNNLGALLYARGDLAGAEPFLRDALAMKRLLYAAARFPDGHPDLAQSLNNLGGLLQSRGDLAAAEPFFRDALAMYRQLYPATRFPAGHPYLARSLKNLGALLQARGDLAAAEPFYRDALAMRQQLSATFADAAAEAETLHYLTQMPPYRDRFLSGTAQRPDSGPAAAYATLWQGRAVLARALERRQRLLHRLRDDDDRAALRELLAVRGRLARLVLDLDRQKTDRDQLLQQLSDRKDQLEKALVAKLPHLADVQVPFTALTASLPEDAALVDLYRYVSWPKAATTWGPPHYVAFVLRSGRVPVRVELGPAQAIDKALAAWRQAIAAGLDSAAAADLRRLLWEPLAAHLPTGPSSTVYLCPDGELSALPWAALPGRAQGTVLLEDHALALVPHGPFLLQHLREGDHPRSARSGLLLALGGVHYDRPAAAVPDAPSPAEPVRLAQRSDRAGVWPALPATAREAAHIAALAQGLPQPPPVRQRAGTAASVRQLLVDLPQARWAHLATHGFFATPDSGARKYLYEEKDFLRGLKGERIGSAARHPLTQTGLVLAGANLKGKDAGPDGGILTAEALAGLDLSGLELAVLSACETGLGEAAHGEGIFGLQRAFHLAGTRNVVASLWKVDDEATAALMALFYHHLWQEQRPPLEALRRAQLALYRNPQAVPLLARQRGPDFDVTVRRVSQAPAPAAEPRSAGRAAVKDWAAFVLSGVGQ